MNARFLNYEKCIRENRKIFSEVQKRIIACRQKYLCFGQRCQGKILLPETWELDHHIPLYAGGTNYYDFNDFTFRSYDKFLEVSTKRPETADNLAIKCSGCHALKTQTERVDWYRIERECKFGTEKFELASVFYKKEEVMTTEAPVISPYFDKTHPLYLRNTQSFQDFAYKNNFRNNKL
jgi:hypothetical protein